MPVIGIGSRDHALAARLDTLIEPRFDAGAIVRSIAAQPLAARIVTQLLRLVPHLPDEDALAAESLRLRGAAGK